MLILFCVIDLFVSAFALSVIILTTKRGRLLSSNEWTADQLHLEAVTNKGALQAILLPYSLGGFSLLLP